MKFSVWFDALLIGKVSICSTFFPLYSTVLDEIVICCNNLHFTKLFIFKDHCISYIQLPQGIPVSPVLLSVIMWQHHLTVAGISQ